MQLLLEHLDGEPGLGRFEPGGAGALYDHGNLVGTNEVMTGDAGSPPVTARRVFTAFGEPVYEDGGAPSTSAVQTRYKFGGAWQYETGLGRDENGADPLPFLRIGHRWYDPSTGRFLLRDPIGIIGGMNVYVYCENSPLDCFDPEGESWWPNRGYLRYGPSRIGFGAGGKGIYRIAFRVGPSIHMYGFRGALCAGGSVSGAAAIGYGAGRAIDNATQWATGTSLSDRIGNRIWDWFGGGPPGYVVPNSELEFSIVSDKDSGMEEDSCESSGRTTLARRRWPSCGST